MKKIKIFSSVPQEISLSPEDFLRYLNTTSVIKVEPKKQNSARPIVISCLMHGNEPSGFYAIHEFLQNKTEQQKLQRTVYFLFLNIKAALTHPIFSTRHTDDESDMNRIWRDAGINLKQNHIVEELKKFLTEINPEYALDFHNTTGNNPIFTCIVKQDPQDLQLAAALSPITLDYPGNRTMIGFLSNFCQGLAVECGKNIYEQSHENAKVALQTFLITTQSLSGTVKSNPTLQVLHSPQAIKLNPACTIEFSAKNTTADLVFRPDLDELNNATLPKGTSIGHINNKTALDCSLFEIRGNELLLKEDTTFLMLSRIVDVIKKDCLGYIVKTKQLKVEA